MDGKQIGFLRAKNFINKRHYHDALVIIHLCCKNLSNAAKVWKKESIPANHWKSFYLCSSILAALVEKMSDIPDKSERTIVTDGKVIYMQAPIQQYTSPRHVKPLKHRCT